MLISVQRMEITWQLIMKNTVMCTCVYIIAYLLHSCSYVRREIPMALPIICGSKLLPSKYDTIANYIGRLLHEVKVLK